MDISINRLESKTLPSVTYLLTKSQQDSLTGGAIQGLVASVDEAGVGVLLFYNKGQDWVIPFFQVARGYRSLGIGSQLLSALRRLATQQSKRLVIPFTAKSTRDDIYRFFARQPSIDLVRQSEFCATITRQNIEKNTVPFSRIVGNPSIPLFAQPTSVIHNLSQTIAPQFPQISQTLWFAPQTYSPDLSFCTVLQTQITSACLVEEGTDFANLALLYSLPGCGNKAIQALLSSMHAILERPLIQRVNLVIATDASSALLTKICPDYIPTHSIYHGYF